MQRGLGTCTLYEHKNIITLWVWLGKLCMDAPVYTRIENTGIIAFRLLDPCTIALFDHVCPPSRVDAAKPACTSEPNMYD